MVNLNSKKHLRDSKITYQGLKLICEKMQQILANSLIIIFPLKKNKPVNFSEAIKLRYTYIFTRNCLDL